MSQSETLPSHIYTVIIAVEGLELIVPNSAVAEVLGQETFRPRQGHGPDWHQGELHWQDLHMPVLSLEALLGQPVPPLERKCRLVALRAPGSETSFALISRSYPMIITLNQAALKFQPSEDADEATARYLMSRARMANREVVVPDLDALAAAAREVD